MNKKPSSAIMTRLCWGAFFLVLLFLAVQVIPHALGQRNATKRSLARPAAQPNAVFNPASGEVQAAVREKSSEPTVPLAVPELPYDLRVPVTADNVLNHVKSESAKETQFAPSLPIQSPLGVVNCNTQPGIIIHDDGIIENGYSGNPAGGVTEVRFVDKFTPTSYPNSFTDVCLDFVTLAGGPPTYLIDVVVYDDDGAGGSPGTFLGSLNAQSATTHVFMAGGAPTWNSYDISSLGLNITSGSVYIGARWMPPSPINVYVSADQTGAVGFAGGYWWNNNAGVWATIQTAFPAYHSLMVRAVAGMAGPTPTPTPTPSCTPSYIFTVGTGTIVPGTTDTGNHGDDISTVIALPFPVSIYGTSYTSAAVGSNGHLTFGTVSNAFTLSCMPVALATDAMGPYWRDQRTDAVGGCTGCGIFTSTTGTAPNRVFHVEYRTIYFGQTSATPTLNYEVNLYESGIPAFDYTYGLVTPFTAAGRFLTVGVQKNATLFTEYGCDPTGGTNPPVSTGQQLTATLLPCGTPTPTPTPTCTPGGWNNEPPMANARRNPATAVVGSNMYAITGFDSVGPYTTANEAFNGTTWMTMAPIPVRHAQGRAAAVGTNIYVPGGFNSIDFGGPLDTMQIYNTVSNSWSSGMNLPAARSGVATAAFNNLVYVIGGYNPTGTGHTEVYIYNPGTNSYTTGAPMTAGQGNMAGVLFNGEIFVVGGGTAPGAQYAYNPTTNMWRTIPPLPTTGGMCQSDNGFVFGGELWIVGCLNLPINQQVWIYNPGTNMWRAGPPYSVDHAGPGAALFNARGFVVGGGAAAGGSTAVESVGGCPGGTPTPTPTATVTPTATPTATPGGGCTVMGSITAGDPTMAGRMFRDGIPSTCAVPKVCPGPFDATPHHYDSYTFTNTTGSTQCVTVTVDAMTCVGANFIFAQAYLGSFNPADMCQNYLADIGGSPNPVAPFSFNLPNGQSVVIVINEVAADSGCVGYTVTLDNICGGGTPTPTPTATATATATPTATATATPTATATATPTATATATPTATATATPTATATATPTATPPPTPTPTATPPPTPTPTATPPPTPTPSATAFPRPTPGPSGTPGGTPPPRP